MDGVDGNNGSSLVEEKDSDSGYRTGSLTLPPCGVTDVVALYPSFFSLYRLLINTCGEVGGEGRTLIFVSEVRQSAIDASGPHGV